MKRIELQKLKKIWEVHELLEKLRQSATEIQSRKNQT